jgi:hypothetical protein
MRVSEGPEGIPYGREEQVVVDPLVMQAHCIQLMWSCKYNVVVLYRQGILHQVIDPKCLFRCLAFGTVTVTTAVVTVTDRTTVIAHLFMPTKYSGAAPCDLSQHLLLQEA